VLLAALAVAIAGAAGIVRWRQATGDPAPAERQPAALPADATPTAGSHATVPVAPAATLPAPAATLPAAAATPPVPAATLPAPATDASVGTKQVREVQRRAGKARVRPERRPARTTSPAKRPPRPRELDRPFP